MVALNGTFVDRTIYPTGDSSTSVFNNDDLVDFVVADEGIDSIGVLYGFNSNTFKTQTIYST